jgi:4'-phosphopantetheinyl transferase
MDAMAQALLALPPDRVHLWYTFPERLRDPGLVDRYREMLSPEEIARLDRFHFERNRHEYLVAHALVRTALSRYHPTPPADWRFIQNQHGKPDLAESLNGRRLRFNLAHCDGLVACGVVWEKEIGVDAENAARRGDYAAVAERFFAPAEVSQLRNAPAERRQDLFFQFWTLKEAWIKARGVGLGLPLGDFGFQFESGLPQVFFQGALREEDPACWQFAQFRPSDFHLLAAAVECGPAPLAIELRETVPLAGVVDI